MSFIMGGLRVKGSLNESVCFTFFGLYNERQFLASQMEMVSIMAT